MRENGFGVEWMRRKVRRSRETRGLVSRWWPRVESERAAVEEDDDRPRPGFSELGDLRLTRSVLSVL